MSKPLLSVPVAWGAPFDPGSLRPWSPYATAHASVGFPTYEYIFATNSNVGVRAEQSVGLRFERLVALARALLQALQIEHADVSPPVADHAGLLQGMGHDRDARSPHP
jgi:hypothetical protein